MAAPISLARERIARDLERLRSEAKQIGADGALLAYLIDMALLEAHRLAVQEKCELCDGTGWVCEAHPHGHGETVRAAASVERRAIHARYAILLRRGSRLGCREGFGLSDGWGERRRPG